jgi:hypothetical protein
MTEGRTRKGTVSLPGRGAASSVVDELRTAAVIPAAPTTPTVAPIPTPVPLGPAAPVAAAGAAPPPPKKHAPAREQFSTKLPPRLIKDLREFCSHHQAEIQVVVELALVEYLTSRGWETGT